MLNTMIRVSYETKDRLKKAGKKGESYDDIINRLVKQKKRRNDK